MGTEKDAIIDFCNALEAACVKLRMNLDDGHLSKANDGARQWTWNPSKIEWENKNGDKGPYEKSNDQNSTDYANMLTDLHNHKGKLNRDGFFYWEFQNGGVGRKKVAK